MKSYYVAATSADTAKHIAVLLHTGYIAVGERHTNPTAAKEWCYILDGPHAHRHKVFHISVRAVHTRDGVDDKTHQLPVDG